MNTWTTSVLDILINAAMNMGVQIRESDFLSFLFPSVFSAFTQLQLNLALIIPWTLLS
jgi:hypothetical protein